MADLAIQNSVDRIERALARMETAMGKPRGNDDLVQKHEKLRERTEAAISRIDQLLKSGEA